MPKWHWEAAQMNQRFINILITAPQYVSRLAMPLLKCQIQYQWGIETLSGIVMKTCQGAKMQTEGGCDFESSSLADAFSRFLLGAHFLTTPVTNTFHHLLENILTLVFRPYYQIRPIEVKNIMHCCVLTTQADISLWYTHSALLPLPLWLTEFTVPSPKSQ